MVGSSSVAVCLHSIPQVSCGNAHTAAVTIDGELYVWGVADGGRLGLGPRLDTQVTVRARARACMCSVLKLLFSHTQS